MFQDGSNRTILSSSLCQGHVPPTSPKKPRPTRGQQPIEPAKSRTLQPDTRITIHKRVLPSTFAHPKADYHVPGVFLECKLTLTHKARNTTHVQIRTHWNTCVEPASHHISTQQSHQETLVPFASLSAISGTFNSLFKVLFTFPSWYLFAIGLEPIFSLR